MKLHVAEDIEAAYEAAGNLKRAQVDYVRSVAQSFGAVLARLGNTPEAALAKQSLDASVLWATMSVLNEQKTEAA